MTDSCLCTSLVSHGNSCGRSHCLGANHLDPLLAPAPREPGLSILDLILEHGLELQVGGG